MKIQIFRLARFGLVCLGLLMLILSSIGSSGAYAASVSKKIVLHSDSGALRPTSCTVGEIQLPYEGYSYINFKRSSDGATVQLQRDGGGHLQAVVYVNFKFNGRYSLPLAVDPGQLIVVTKQKLTLETWLGSVRQVFKIVPVAQFCQETWTGTTYSLNSSGSSTQIAHIAHPAVSRHMTPLTNTSSSTCQAQEYEVPWYGYEYIVFGRADGKSVILQRYIYNGKPTAVVYANYKLQGQYYVPVTISNDMVITLKAITVYGVVNNTIVTFTLSVPVVRFCANVWIQAYQIPQQPHSN